MRFIVYRCILNKANGCVYMLNISCPSQILLLILLVPSQQKGNLARMHSSYVLFLKGRKQNIVFNHSSIRYLYEEEAESSQDRVVMEDTKETRSCRLKRRDKHLNRQDLQRTVSDMELELRGEVNTSAIIRQKLSPIDNPYKV